MQDRSGEAAQEPFRQALAGPRLSFLLGLLGAPSPRIRAACVITPGAAPEPPVLAAAGPGAWWWAGAGGDAAEEAEIAEAAAPALAAELPLRLVPGGLPALLEGGAGEERREAPPRRLDLVIFAGAWTGLSEGDRRAAARLAAARLRPGGLLALDYAVRQAPGPETVLRGLARAALTPRRPRGGAAAAEVPALLAEMDRLLLLNPALRHEDPLVAEALAALAARPPRAVAWEMCNADWRPAPFAETAALLAAEGLSRIGSLNPMHLAPGLMLTEEQAARLEGETDPVRREALYDFFVGRIGRMELWAAPGGDDEAGAGAAPAPPDADPAFIALPGAGEEGLALEAPIGPVTLSREAYGPLLRALLQARHPVSLAELAAAEGVSAAAGPGELSLRLGVLCAIGLVAPARKAADREAARRCRALNLALARAAAAEGGGPVHLASPLTGGGAPLAPAEAPFALARLSGEDVAPDASSREAALRLERLGVI